MLSKNKIKHLQSLTRKKGRDEFRLFMAEGPKVVEELLDADNIDVLEVYATATWLSAHAPRLSTLARAGYEGKSAAPPVITEITDKELKQVSALTTPNQVIAVARQPVYPNGPELRGRITLLLDSIQDPGNLGTIIRCADWFGIQNVICSPTCADAWNPKVVQSTMGSIARVRVTATNLMAFLDEHAGITDPLPVMAAALDGSSLDQVKGIQEGLLIIGNESRGISQDLMARATHRITIPRTGRAESLNAAVATGIILSHL